jgi:hypothetical protein
MGATSGYRDIPRDRRLTTLEFNVPHYSTDLAAAWRIVDRLCRDEIGQIRPNSFEMWTVDKMFVATFLDRGSADGFGETASLAVCRAALAAKRA